MVQELKWYNYFKKTADTGNPVLGKADLYTQEQKRISDSDDSEKYRRKQSVLSVLKRERESGN